MSKYYVVSSEILPEVLDKVMEAQTLLQSGQARRISEAVKKVGISRGTFYKYKDAVFSFNQDSSKRKAIFTIILKNETGIAVERFEHAFEPEGEHYRAQPVDPNQRDRLGHADDRHYRLGEQHRRFARFDQFARRGGKSGTRRRRMMKALRFLFGWCVLVSVVLGSVRLQAFDRSFYEAYYEKTRLASQIGVSEADLTKACRSCSTLCKESGPI